MQGWLVVGAWTCAVLFAVVVLGFAGYEVAWKARRLAADQAKLAQLISELGVVSARLQDAADRLR